MIMSRSPWNSLSARLRCPAMPAKGLDCQGAGFPGRVHLKPAHERDALWPLPFVKHRVTVLLHLTNHQVLLPLRSHEEPGALKAILAALRAAPQEAERRRQGKPS